MNPLSNYCLAGALLSMVLAIVYQWRDRRPGHGGTLGGEMTAGLLWLVAALLAAVGSYAYLPWYLAVAAFFLVLGLSFLIRIVVARIAG